MLSYLEIHLVDHCNLNCKGCSHFSPLSPKWFIELDSFEAQLLQLKKILNTIGLLRLMGGEPLLHPELRTLINVARSIFPDSRIALVTNGLLLPLLKIEDYNCFVINGIEVHLTKYPSKKQKIRKYKRIFKKFKIKNEIVYTNTFYKRFSLESSQQTINSFDICQQHKFCPAIKDGRIYQCSGLAYLNTFLQYYKMEPINIESYNIFKKEANYSDLISFINSANSLCSHCFLNFKPFNWEPTNKHMSEWLID